MYFIVDTFNSVMLNIVCDDDGNTMYFDTIEEASAYARENIQAWQIVEMNS